MIESMMEITLNPDVRLPRLETRAGGLSRPPERSRAPLDSVGLPAVLRRYETVISQDRPHQRKLATVCGSHIQLR